MLTRFRVTAAVTLCHGESSCTSGFSNPICRQNKPPDVERNICNVIQGITCASHVMMKVGGMKLFLMKCLLFLRCVWLCLGEYLKIQSGFFEPHNKPDFTHIQVEIEIQVRVLNSTEHPEVTLVSVFRTGSERNLERNRTLKETSGRLVRF